MAGVRGDRLGERAVDDIVRLAFSEYRKHLELVYPFLAFGAVSLLLEFRFDLLLSLFEIDRSFSVTADPDHSANCFPTPSLIR